MSMEQTSFETRHSLPDENVQAAEAVEVLRHAVWKMSRGGRQGATGRKPSMIYSGSRSRNPRECLRRAHEDLGFSSFKEAKNWLEQQPIDWSNKLDLAIKPSPRNIEGLEFLISHPSVQLDYPTRLQKLLRYLNKSDIADVHPIVFGIRDMRGITSRLIMKIMSDPRPQDRESIVLDGRLIMRKGRAVHCTDGQVHAIFPGHMARLHIDPAQSLRHVEFLDIPACEDA